MMVHVHVLMFFIKESLGGRLLGYGDLSFIFWQVSTYVKDYSFLILASRDSFRKVNII